MGILNVVIQVCRMHIPAGSPYDYDCKLTPLGHQGGKISLCCG